MILPASWVAVLRRGGRGCAGAGGGGRGGGGWGGGAGWSSVCCISLSFMECRRKLTWDFIVERRSQEEERKVVD